jgi:hypothetical protein
MCKPQFAQIDCRIIECVFHDKRGNCTNKAPAITIRANGSFCCWSMLAAEDAQSEDENHE